METFDLYNDIATRTGGDIYLGVVGPVRTGKSTFIKRFMDKLVLPNIEDKNVLSRAIDELPQSADGKTVMTTQPKFVPSEAVNVRIGENINASVRLIDCVGYLVDEALGATEGDKKRMVKTPWSEEEMTFEESAEMGTTKAIEHSTIGVLLTSDGSIVDIPRATYIEAEEKAVNCLKAIGKPFVIILNSKHPADPDTIKLRDALSERYRVQVISLDVLNMELTDINDMFEKILQEFPIKQVDVFLPDWMRAMTVEDDIIRSTIKTLEDNCDIYKMSEAKGMCNLFADSEYYCKCDIQVEMGSGKVLIYLQANRDLFFKELSKLCGNNIEGEFELMKFVKTLSEDARRYGKLKEALKQVEETGYGVVVPDQEDLILEEPEIMKQAGKFGVRLKASAPSLHIMRVDVNTEVNPIVGSEQQSEELVKYLLEEFESNKKGIWDTNMFGKSLASLVNEGLGNKIFALPEEAKKKLRKALGKIVNEGKGGIICILL